MTVDKSMKKEKAAESVVSMVKDGMVVGLGTGSTAELAIMKLGERVKLEELEILGVPTSLRTEMVAIESGIRVTTLSEHPSLDISIDGADQVDLQLNLVKGGWGSHTKEKIVSYAAKRFVICVDDSKMVKRLNKPVPLEVLPYAVKVVEAQVKRLGGVPVLRQDGNRGGYFITEGGNLILDVDMGTINNPEEMSMALSSIVGSVEHGIFTNASEVHVGDDEGVEILKK
ncbi:MAG: ribose-5-phosphate isomerase RpiA [Methanophagales archaeon]|nr:ribose-5-phosphate isomerase RpiA [Methanophagales archaeon]MCW3139165.1 ribose-5-phosphate isomerase RpiA [Methanophagales archaeon]MCW7070411.1 ribose-5-phosphate isomerase RpiA [Methanophagales archaeon]MCW7073526.1 ribose-5-phosphate isomerase RpiA [Methanophagales archaeon]